MKLSATLRVPMVLEIFPTLIFRTEQDKPFGSAFRFNALQCFAND